MVLKRLFQIFTHRRAICSPPPTQPNLHTPFPPPFSPSLISLMVSVDVKHHVYTNLTKFSSHLAVSEHRRTSLKLGSRRQSSLVPGLPDRRGSSSLAPGLPDRRGSSLAPGLPDRRGSHSLTLALDSPGAGAGGDRRTSSLSGSSKEQAGVGKPLSWKSIAKTVMPAAWVGRKMVSGWRCCCRRRRCCCCCFDHVLLFFLLILLSPPFPHLLLLALLPAFLLVFFLVLLALVVVVVVICWSRSCCCRCCY